MTQREINCWLNQSSQKTKNIIFLTQIDSGWVNNKLETC